MAEKRSLTTYPCSRCGFPMEPKIVFVRVGYRAPIDVCSICAEEIEAFAKLPIKRETSSDTITQPMFDAI